MISVCMSTYNGEKYIYKQLESIYNQTRRPDEVIICDDCSMDNTVKIIKDFILKYGLDKNWKLFCNEENKGYPQNFYYTMNMCRGDIIFLADQDDVWLDNKITNMVDVMEKNSQIKLLASKWGIIDKDDVVLKKVSRGKVSKKIECKKITIHDILYYYDWPGMCMCYRREFGEEVISRSESSNIPHDMALGIVAAEFESFFCINQKFQYHRRHENNLAMEEHRVNKLLKKDRKIAEIEKYIEMLQEMLKSSCLTKEHSIYQVIQKKEIMQERLFNLQTGNRKNILGQYLKHKGEIRLMTLVCDWIICKEKVDKDK